MNIDKMFADARVRVHESIDAHAEQIKAEFIEQNTAAHLASDRATLTAWNFSSRSIGQRVRRLRERVQRKFTERELVMSSISQIDPEAEAGDVVDIPGHGVGAVDRDIVCLFAFAALAIIHLVTELL